MIFDKIFERIKRETEIKSMAHLAKMVGTAQSYVSKKRKEDKFPVEWAYIVGREYDLLTEWILTGNGPKSLNDENERKIKLLNEVECWILNTDEEERGAVEWFTYDFRKKYPEFVEWLRKKEAEETEKNKDQLDES
ncbi:MAG: helix-turn-helix domain containing protein [Proteobacteria bacterium]|nr:helix-turn-helix domain containing protein [Pseudomonadota bacterium]MBU1739019.1 helix-turn-helix domain containing protein [Pseudomonadota bacterium]